MDHVKTAYWLSARKSEGGGRDGKSGLGRVPLPSPQAESQHNVETTPDALSSA